MFESFWINFSFILRKLMFKFSWDFSIIFEFSFILSNSVRKISKSNTLVLKFFISFIIIKLLLNKYSIVFIKFEKSKEKRHISAN